MSDKFKLTANLSSYASMFLIELNSGQLAMGFEIARESPRTFDKHRPPLVMLDGGMAIDFGVSKDAQEVMDATGGESGPFYRFEPRVVIAVIWHGRKNEAWGQFGKLLESKIISAKLYYDDYTSEDFTFSDTSLAEFKSRIVTGLGLKVT